MTAPLRPRTAPNTGLPYAPHEIDLDGMLAGSYFKIGRHWFMAARMNLTTVARAPRLSDEDPVRDFDEIDMKLVHAPWQGCDD